MFRLPALVQSLSQNVSVSSTDTLQQDNSKKVGAPSITIKANGTFRVKTIKISRSSKGIDRLLFQYDDGTEWQCGHDGGCDDARKVVLTKNEYIVKVTHERFPNFKFAAAAITFETNFGRRFEYTPNEISTKDSKQETVSEALPGYEIISLRIRKGVLYLLSNKRFPNKHLRRIGAKNGMWWYLPPVSQNGKRMMTLMPGLRMNSFPFRMQSRSGNSSAKQGKALFSSTA